MFDLKELAKISSFSGRRAYCKWHLKSLGSGSARQVFALDENRALKLAINMKGTFQNATESDYGLIKMYSTLLPECYDHDEDHRWIIVERMERKPTAKEMREFLGGDMKMLHYGFVNRNLLDYYVNDVIEDIEDLIYNTDLCTGDLPRPSTWGVTKDGHIKIADFGLTNRIFRSYYQNFA